MATVGPNYGSVDAFQSSYQFTLSNPTRICSLDGSYVSGQYTTVGTSDIRKLTGFGFSLPDAAVITGIKCEAYAYASYADDGLRMARFCFWPKAAGGKTGNSLTTSMFPLSPGWLTVGGDGDLYGQTWVGSDFNLSAGGCYWQVDIDSTGPAVIGYVDALRMTLYYTVGYANKVLGCLPATIAKIMGIPTANVGKFCGV